MKFFIPLLALAMAMLVCGTFGAETFEGSISINKDGVEVLKVDNDGGKPKACNIDACAKHCFGLGYPIAICAGDLCICVRPASTD